MELKTARIFVSDLAAARQFYSEGLDTGLSFTVPDAAATYQDLAARGVPFVAPPERQSWGGVVATLQDPSGNAVQIVQHPTAA